MAQFQVWILDLDILDGGDETLCIDWAKECYVLGPNIVPPGHVPNSECSLPDRLVGLQCPMEQEGYWVEYRWLVDQG